MIKCKNCDGILEENAQFCAYCGTPVIKEKIVKIDNKKTKMSKWIYLFIGLVVVTSIALILLNIIPLDKSNTVEKVSQSKTIDIGGITKKFIDYSSTKVENSSATESYGHLTRSKEMVVDTQRNLMWQDNEAAQNIKKTWKSANEYCKNLSLGGYNDWRLPSELELLRIIDHSRYDPAIFPLFKYAASGIYWSSRRTNANSEYATGVYFEYGGAGANKLYKKLYVRCVRNR